MWIARRTHHPSSHPLQLFVSGQWNTDGFGLTILDFNPTPLGAAPDSAGLRGSAEARTLATRSRRQEGGPFYRAPACGDLAGTPKRRSEGGRDGGCGDSEAVQVLKGETGALGL